MKRTFVLSALIIGLLCISPGKSEAGCLLSKLFGGGSCGSSQSCESAPSCQSFEACQPRQQTHAVEAEYEAVLVTIYESRGGQLYARNEVVLIKKRAVESKAPEPVTTTIPTYSTSGNCSNGQCKPQTLQVGYPSFRR